MTIRLYNTYTRRKEEFVPRDEGKVAMYVCGPTTYDYIHLGNARPLIVFDTVRRYFEYRGYEVTFVQNFTDIDDKIIQRAQEEGEDPLRLSARFIEEYFRDAAALRVRPATVHPRVTEHIPEIIAMIEKIIANGHAYVVDGDVYFDVRSFPAYGSLSGRQLEDMLAGARVEVDERKRDPMDFALWKKAKPGEPAWDSPWGKGRPGWHIECSAMSLKYLGPGFDIHGGGFDLIFPHHENELAQARAWAGKEEQGPVFARYWMHNGFITVREEKMSKSLGNFFTVREILEKFRPEAVRFFILSTHYRSPLDFDPEKLETAERSLKRLENTWQRVENLVRQLAGKGGEDSESSRRLAETLRAALVKARQQFREAMDDDFNTALALAAIFDLAREVNSFCQEVERGGVAGLAVVEAGKEAIDTFAELVGVLGLEKEEKEVNTSGLVEGLISILIEVRQEARQRKDWATADKIRDRMKELGIVLEDTPTGVRWRMEERE